MKINFILRNSLYIRNFGESIKQLADQGHEVVFTLTQEREDTDPKDIDALTDYSSKITRVDPAAIKHPWGEYTGKIRNIRNYIRYLHPTLISCHGLKARAEARVEESIVEKINRVPESFREKYRIYSQKLLSFIDNAIPPAPGVLKFLESNPCDLLVVSPLVDLDSDEIEYAKAAKQMGIPTCLCVASWDNLTNKGIIQGDPDTVVVWNDAMAKEARDLHGIPAEDIFTTGAQLFDWWYTNKSVLTREAFCEKLGLDPSKKIITYLCSSTFISKNETNFVHAWASILRLHDDPAISEANIVVRPHPASGKKYWSNPDIKFKKLKNFAVWPKGGEFTTNNPDARTNYFTTLYWSDAVFGVNTSAFLEAGIMGKPCFTVENNSFKEAHDQTVHFGYLKDGGLVNCSDSFEKYLIELQKAFNTSGKNKNAERFIHSFIRPNGADKPATDSFVETLTEFIPAHISKKNIRPFSPGILHKIARSYLKKYRSTDKHGKIIDSERQSKARHHERKNRKQVPRSELEGSLEHSIIKCLDEATPVISELRRICKSNKTIIMGPWQSEVGYELLYWIPFLRWCMKKFKINPAKCIVISRGGCSKWYEDISQEYFEILSEYSPKEFLCNNEHRVAENGGIRRHSIVSEFDKEIIEKVKKKFSVDDCEILHPQILYSLLRSYTLNLLEYRFISAKMRYKPFTWKSASVLEDYGLEEKKYSTVKFYSSDQLLDNGDLKSFTSKLISRLAEKGKVVVLENNYKLDDHENITTTTASNIITLGDKCKPDNNLEIQSALVAGSTAFYGTYGGFSYLAPLYGLNSFNFYNESDNLVSAHVQAAQAIFNGNQPYGNFFMCHTDDWSAFENYLAKPEPVAS